VGIVSNRSETKSRGSGGEPISLRFVAPQIPGPILAHYYAGPKRKGIRDESFLDKIDGPFMCLTAAILCQLLRCWRTGLFIDNVAFTRASSEGKINYGY